MINKLDFSKFGIGTFGIGGLMERDASLYKSIVDRPEWENIDWEYEGTGGTKISELSFVF